MSYYDGGSTDNGYRDPGVRFVSGTSGAKTYEEKAARKFLDSIGTLTFNSLMFSFFITSKGPEMDKRVMEVIKETIRSYADMWDSGIQTEATRDAKRLADTLHTFDM